MSPDDSKYFESRAEAELEMARQAKDRRAVQAHYELANAYLERVHPADGAPDPKSA